MKRVGGKPGKRTAGNRGSRVSKREYYLGIAEQVAIRSTCLRRNFGAVIVKNDQIVSTGYNGAPRKTEDCLSVGFCYRDKVGAKRGEKYELCRAVHAEANAIIHAARFDMLGGTLYVVGLDPATRERVEDAGCCRMCKRMIINAGIDTVVITIGKKRTREFSVAGWQRTNLGEISRKGGRAKATQVSGY